MDNYYKKQQVFSLCPSIVLEVLLIQVLLIHEIRVRLVKQQVVIFQDFFLFFSVLSVFYRRLILNFLCVLPSSFLLLNFLFGFFFCLCFFFAYIFHHFLEKSLRPQYTFIHPIHNFSLITHFTVELLISTLKAPGRSV